MTAVAAPPGTNIVVLDRSDKKVVRIPVVAFDVNGTIAYPVAAIAFGGLLKGVRALELNGLITDRGYDIPFDSQEAWIMWSMSVTPGAESEAQRQAEEPEEEDPNRSEPAAPKTPTKPTQTKARKVFASKSFWSRTNMLGVLEVVEIEPGQGLPYDAEGFEKIKRDDYAAFKKQAKAGDEQVLVIAWDNGPVIPGESDEIIEETMEAGDDYDDSGLV